MVLCSISAASVIFIKYCRQLWQVSHSSLQSELSILFLNKVGHPEEMIEIIEVFQGGMRALADFPGISSPWNYRWTI